LFPTKAGHHMLMWINQDRGVSGVVNDDCCLGFDIKCQISTINFLTALILIH